MDPVEVKQEDISTNEEDRFLLGDDVPVVKPEVKFDPTDEIKIENEYFADDLFSTGPVLLSRDPLKVETDDVSAHGPDPSRNDNDTEIGPSFKCTLCGEGFPTMSQVIRHIRSHTGVPTFKASIINMPVGKAQSEEAYHRNLNPFMDVKKDGLGHANNLSPPQTQTSLNKLTSTTPEKRTKNLKNAAGRLHKCSECNQQFVGFSQLARHKKSHSIQPRQEFDKGMEPQPTCDVCWCTSWDKPKGQKTEEKLQCIFCNKYLTAPGHLRRHLRIFHNMKHNTPRPTSFKCQVCPETFPTQVELDNHERRKQHMARQICRFCGKLYTSITSCRKHEDKQHPQNNAGAEGLAHSKVAKCSFCGSWFSSKGSLTFHNRTCPRERTTDSSRLVQEIDSEKRGNQRECINPSFIRPLVTSNSKKLIIPDIMS